MRFGKYPAAPIILPLLFGARFVVNHFYPDKKATFDPMLTGMLEIAIVVFLIYYIRLFIKWAYNYRKAA